MAIMQSCCCWRSVRRGSFACAIYTGVYFILIAMSTGTVLQEEEEYLYGNRSMPKSPSFLEHESVSPVTVRFNITLLICSCCGVVACLLLLYGLLKNHRFLMLPWICSVITCSIVDISHTLYLFCSASLGFSPISALVYTLDFFLLCLNIYSLLCVISQYQEYTAGRGRASDDCEHRIPAIRYAVQPTTTATSCLSSRRTPTNNDSKLTTSTTPAQSPTTYRTILSSEKSTGNKIARKHVQFPDTPTSSSQAPKSDNSGETIGWTSDNESPAAPSLLMPPSNNFHQANGQS
ncbi:uncharacterized protein LOC107040468 isoform X1 [Diachasma alloeum]|uniref:uncharacterized protein LOC107040468 isoform X1 n=1 Tax=Diachasma alloeum TaxID=454923 RepID=UPI0007382465|nr:uncharacterized protein LOC107040468 isoform X1 [Diachasma alloeum]XP_015116049.1 uncharacterized protein LOC107040468 isoform X1 [Diachasma alloeum]